MSGSGGRRARRAVLLALATAALAAAAPAAAPAQRVLHLQPGWVTERGVELPPGVVTTVTVRCDPGSEAVFGAPLHMPVGVAWLRGTASGRTYTFEFLNATSRSEFVDVTVRCVRRPTQRELRRIRMFRSRKRTMTLEPEERRTGLVPCPRGTLPLGLDTQQTAAGPDPRRPHGLARFDHLKPVRGGFEVGVREIIGERTQVALICRGLVERIVQRVRAGQGRNPFFYRFRNRVAQRTREITIAPGLTVQIQSSCPRGWGSAQPGFTIDPSLRGVDVVTSYLSGARGTRWLFANRQDAPAEARVYQLCFDRTPPFVRVHN